LLLSQRDPSEEDPEGKDLYNVGTVATVLQLLKLPDGTVKVLVEGQHRAEVKDVRVGAEYLEADVAPVEDEAIEEADLEALVRSATKHFEQYVRLNKKVAPEVVVQVGQIEDPSRLADTIASNLSLKIADKQALLAERS